MFEYPYLQFREEEEAEKLKLQVKTEGEELDSLEVKEFGP